MNATSSAEVMKTAAALVEAFGSHDPAAYFPFFADDATFIFYTHPEILTSRASWEKLWAQWEHDLGFKVHSCESQDAHVQLLGSDAAVFRHIVLSSIEMEGVLEVVKERETIVFHHDGLRWVAVHEHLSPWDDQQ
ncbi:MAG: SnoaL-like domain-containing protein [Microbacteriaceae bacterium]|jgi:ketosteroid isomerase-like protein|nr:SnoaL-like domain-containing protein [Microbacteriaceae bacterium]